MTKERERNEERNTERNPAMEDMAAHHMQRLPTVTGRAEPITRHELEMRRQEAEQPREPGAGAPPRSGDFPKLPSTSPWARSIDDVTGVEPPLGLDLGPVLGQALGGGSEKEDPEQCPDE